MKSRNLVLAILLIVALGYLWIGAVTELTRITQKGTLHTLGVEVYASNVSTILTELNWGDLIAGNTYWRFGYLKSASDIDATLQYTVDNLPSYLYFNLYYQPGYFSNNTWISTGNWTDLEIYPYLLAPEEWLRLQFELEVPANATTGPFSFDIIISVSS